VEDFHVARARGGSLRRHRRGANVVRVAASRRAREVGSPRRSRGELPKLWFFGVSHFSALRRSSKNRLLTL
jgi:hypothetical protein